MHSRNSSHEDTGDRIRFRTACGRAIQVGQLTLGGASPPVRRVSFAISASGYGDDGTWAGLTAGEARQLAAALLTCAAACEDTGAR
jgi:hypothetical protein